MQHCTTVKNDFPDPFRLIAGLTVGFALAIGANWLEGRHLVELLLPAAKVLIEWLDDRFAIVFFGVEQATQDTVLRLRVTLLRMVVVAGHVTEPNPKAWLEVSTTIGAMLQPLTIGVGLALAWPGAAIHIVARVVIAALLGVGFMMIDIPLTLHAYVWDMFLKQFDPEHFSLLMLFHRFLHGGGRLGIGVLLAIVAIVLAKNLPDSRKQL